MPKLQKGEVAPGIAAKGLRAAASVRAIVATVSGAARDPERRTSELCEHLKTYARIAKWTDPGLQIFPMSENTLRKNIAHEHPGGMRGFESERNAILGQAENGELSSSPDHQMLINYLGELNLRYFDLLDRMLKLQAIDNKVRDALASHLRYFPLNEARDVGLISLDKP